MIIFNIAVASIFIWTGGQSCQFSDTVDPCSSQNHKPFPYMQDRCPDCGYLSNDRSDLYDLEHDIWYGTEFNMTTRYVSPHGCGTRIPIWMNEPSPRRKPVSGNCATVTNSHETSCEILFIHNGPILKMGSDLELLLIHNGNIPMIGEGVVSRTSCVATFDQLCASTYSIKLKRCDSSKTVYCLDNLPSSIQQRYCFDFDPRIFTTTTSTRTSSSNLPTTRPPRTDRGETGVQGWVIAVIAALSITIVGLVAIIVVIVRQFRKNHKRYRTFPDHEMPPPYNQVIGFIPMNEKAVTFVNVKPKY